MGKEKKNSLLDRINRIGSKRKMKHEIILIPGLYIIFLLLFGFFPLRVVTSDYYLMWDFGLICGVLTGIFWLWAIEIIKKRKQKNE